jgi:hypothetical protein
MLKTNVLGSLVVCLVLLTIVGYFINLGFDINWGFFFKVAAIVAVIAAVVSVLTIGGDKRTS